MKWSSKRSGALPRFKGQARQSEAEILDAYIKGYFCHPLRGVLSMREAIAGYDFRATQISSCALDLSKRSIGFYRYTVYALLKSL